MRVDLHTHSTASDGTTSPAQVVLAARGAGLDVVALTDHDTTAGWAAAAQSAQDVGVGLVRGIEVSTRFRGVSVHLLCYLPEPEHPGLVAELAAIRDSRVGRARRMVELIAVDHPITWDDVAERAGGGTVGRPHIADALVAAGVVADRDAAFAGPLAAGSDYYVPYHAPSTDAAIRLVLDAGGVPVLAHPGAAVRGRILDDDAYPALVDAGLAGLEVHHRDHTTAQRARVAKLARRLGLLVTGSSDYHGTGKPNLLGENLTDPDVLAAIVAAGTLPLVGGVPR